MKAVVTARGETLTAVVTAKIENESAATFILRALGKVKVTPIISLRTLHGHKRTSRMHSILTNPAHA